MSRTSRRTTFTYLHYVGTIVASLTIAFLLRFDFTIPPDRVEQFRNALWIAIPVKLVAFGLSPVRRLSWRFVTAGDVLRIFNCALIASICFAIVAMLTIGVGFPRSVFVIDFVIALLGLVGSRLLARIYVERRRKSTKVANKKRLLIYGSGGDGIRLAREIQARPNLGIEVAGFLDDDPAKWKTSVVGIQVLGRGRDAVHFVDSFKRRKIPIDEIVIAISTATGNQMQEILANCRAAGVSCKRLPNISDLIEDKVLIDQLRDISLEDLLGRPPVEMDAQGVRESLHERVVMITGGAGSIGSELCRQIIRCAPKNLIVLDQAESDLFRIDNELREKNPGAVITPKVCSIRDEVMIEEIMRSYGVEVVFHAAAYKHVPLMEAHILEAAKNNIAGTWNVLQAARRQGVRKFVMISSDKAVNPTSIMGLTKRIAELMVLAVSHECRSFGGNYVSVRFGNVLGSNGSVVPTFQAQILKGGPVTVTHPDVKRYFMTIPEAVQLVLQASTMGTGSEIFVLDMGEPVRIVDLARNMIRLAGKIPDEDIEIRFVGLRPGEKLIEELSLTTEDMTATRHEKIWIFKGAGVSKAELENWLSLQKDALRRKDIEALVEHFRLLVPEYQPVKVGPATAGRAMAATAFSQPTVRSA